MHFIDKQYFVMAQTFQMDKVFINTVFFSTEIVLYAISHVRLDG